VTGAHAIAIQFVRGSVHVVLTISYLLIRAVSRWGFRPAAPVWTLSFMAVVFDSDNVALFNGRSSFYAFPVVCAAALDHVCNEYRALSWKSDRALLTYSRSYVLISSACRSNFSVVNASSSSFCCITAFGMAFDV